VLDRRVVRRGHRLRELAVEVAGQLGRGDRAGERGAAGQLCGQRPCRAARRRWQQVEGLVDHALDEGSDELLEDAGDLAQPGYLAEHRDPGARHGGGRLLDRPEALLDLVDQPAEELLDGRARGGRQVAGGGQVDLALGDRFRGTAGERRLQMLQQLPRVLGDPGRPALHGGDAVRLGRPRRGEVQRGRLVHQRLHRVLERLVLELGEQQLHRLGALVAAVTAPLGHRVGERRRQSGGGRLGVERGGCGGFRDKSTAEEGRQRGRVHGDLQRRLPTR
jgi:hypothetical protein